MSEWEPIETCPQGKVILGKWHEDYGWCWITSGEMPDPNEEKGLGWCDFTDDAFSAKNFHHPTHWCHLPASPEPARSA